MGAKVNIPQVFNVADPAQLKRDLERLSDGFSRYAQAASSAFMPAPAPAPVAVLAFGAVTRVSMAVGDRIALQLPQPDVKNGGQTLYIKRETTAGSCTIRGVGALLNGRPTQLLPALPGLYSVYFDGANYYSAQPLAADWTP